MDVSFLVRFAMRILHSEGLGLCYLEERLEFDSILNENQLLNVESKLSSVETLEESDIYIKEGGNDCEFLGGTIKTSCTTNMKMKLTRGSRVPCVKRRGILN